MFRESPPNTPEKVPDTVPFTHIILHQSTIPRNILPGIRRIVKDKQPAGRGRTKDRLRPQGIEQTATGHSETYTAMSDILYLLDFNW